MGWLFFVAWIALTVWGCISDINSNGRFYWSNAFGGSILALCMVSCITIFVAWAVFGDKNRELATVDEYELVQGSQYNRLNGSFAIGCGSIKEEPIYQYYYKDEDGAYILDYIYCEGSKIVETDDTPRVVVYRCWRGKHPSSRFARWWLGPLLDCDYPYGKRMGILYVPKGTIVEKNFNSLNLD